jgi:SAM-dependent methyltransferase
MLDACVDLIRRSLNDDRKDRLKLLLERLGFDHRNWSRIAMYIECRKFMENFDNGNMDVLEISGGREWASYPFGSYTSTHYPDFDICEDVLDREFDLIIADQVFEHISWPEKAGRNIYTMLKPGGWFFISTPFLIQVHHDPQDCRRWTRVGMKYLLAECGFSEERIQTFSWGNRACVKANLYGWPKKWPWRSLKNEPDFPVVVWAFAQK